MSLNENHSFAFENSQQPRDQSDLKTDSQLPSKPRRVKNTWTKSEIEQLFSACQIYSVMSGRPLHRLEPTEYAFISLGFEQNGTQCMAKMKEILSSGTLKPGIWNAAEDEYLTKLMQEERQQWKHLAKALNRQFHNGVAVRNGKTVRERWNNYLNPNINRGPWTPEEDLILLRGIKERGKKWALIAKDLGNRTDGAVKNRFKSLIIQEKQSMTANKIDLIDRIISSLSPEEQQ